ncbi:MAG: CoA transferase [Streptosporangiaceae bacterium]
MAEATFAPAATVLGGVRVLDWTDETGAYAGRLLADLGADVVRLEVSGDPWPQEIMTAGQGQAPASALERFVNLNKRSVRVNLAAPAGRDLAASLLDQADVVITSGPAAREWQQAGGVLRPHGTGIHVSVSPFGQRGDGAGLLADDLVTLAASGLLSLGGYADAEPVAVYGSQTYFAGGINAAIGALFGLLAVDAGQPAADIDVSAQAVMASALEDAAAEFDLTGSVRRRTGDGLREAGTGTFACADGWIVIVAGKLGTADAWDSLVSWLCEQGAPGAEALKAPEWATLEHRRRQESIDTFQQVMDSATAGRARQALYAELQGRRVAAAPVNGVADLLTDSQLRDREFFRQVHDVPAGAVITYPGPPYRLADHVMPSWTAAPAPGGHTEQVLRDWLNASGQQLAVLRDTGAIE